MSKPIVMVPVHLDALYLNQQMLVKEAFANFENLPFRNGPQDYNPDTANISESILSVPFQNDNLNLKQGIHLHWSLPDALTNGGASGTEQDYPAVPNRWMVSRKSTLLGDKKWVVESDYCSTPGWTTFMKVSLSL